MKPELPSAVFAGLLTAAMASALTAAIFLPPAAAGADEPARCAPSPFEGRWRNVNPQARHVVSLDIKTSCEVVASNRADRVGKSPWESMLDRPTTRILRSYALRPFSKCAPANCPWGRKRGKLDANGALRAKFRLFWSERFLKITSDKGKLLVDWRMVFYDRSKPAKTGTALLERDD